MRYAILIIASIVLASTPAWAASTSVNVPIAVTGGSGGSTITGLSLTAQTFTGNTNSAAAPVGTVALAGNNNGAATLAISGPDAAVFQLSGNVLQVISANQSDGLYHIFLTPTLSGAPGSGVLYPFEIAGTVSCDQMVTTGFTSATITNAITVASAGQIICLQGSGTLTTPVAVNKGVRITGVNSFAASPAAWYSAVPALTVSGQIAAFNVSGNPVTIDHLNAIGATVANNGGVCGGFSSFIHNTAALTSFVMNYNQTTNFMCDYWLGGVSNVTGMFNLMNGSGYVGLLCDPCNTSSFSNNQSVSPTDTTEPNEYPFVVSGDGLSTAITFTNNSAINPIWECFDDHGSTDIHWISNYCVGAARVPSGAGFANTAINQPGNGGVIVTRPRANGNFLDRGSAACAGCNTIVQVAGGGGSMTCTGGDGAGCQIENNIVLFGANDNSSCGLFATGADGGTTTGSQIISGNTCGGAMATMAAPALTTDQPSNAFVAGQGSGVIGKISVAMTPAFPPWVGGWPNYGGWPGTFSIGGTDAAQFQVCVDGQHVCQKSAGTPAGTYNITITGTLAGLSNSPQTSSTISLTGS